MVGYMYMYWACIIGEVNGQCSSSGFEGKDCGCGSDYLRARFGEGWGVKSNETRTSLSNSGKENGETNTLMSIPNPLQCRSASVPLCLPFERLTVVFRRQHDSLVDSQ